MWMKGGWKGFEFGAVLEYVFNTSAFPNADVL